MGLLSGRNVKKAKSLLEKNRHKVGGIVDKATDQVNKVTKGKTANVTAKIDGAAHKFSGSDAGQVDQQPDDQSNDTEAAETTGDADA
jgi:hypothetical protein